MRYYFLLIVLLIPLLVGAQSVIISWDPNSEPDLAGYKVYYGNESRSYNTLIDIGLPPLNNNNRVEHEVNNLDSLKYYFAVTAYDTANNESEYSEEVWVDFREYGINEYIVQKKDIVFMENTSYRDSSIYIWGLGGDSCGVKFTNPGNPIPYEIDFDIRLVGSGTCIDTLRDVKIQMDNLTKTIIVDTVDVHYNYTTYSNTVQFFFFDDCWIPGESDANIRITNLKQIYGDYIEEIRQIRKGRNIMLEVK